MSQIDKHSVLLHSKLIGAAIHVEQGGRRVGEGFLVDNGVAVFLRDILSDADVELRTATGDRLGVEGVLGDDPEMGLVLLKVSGKVPECLAMVRGGGGYEIGGKVQTVLEGGSAATNTLEEIVQVPCWAALLRFETEKPLAPGTPVTNRKGQVIAVAISFQAGIKAGYGIPAAYIPVHGGGKPMLLRDWLSVRSPSMMVPDIEQAYVALRRDDIPGAIVHVEQVIAAGTRYASHSVLAGLLYEKTDQPEKAEGSYRSAVGMSADNAAAWKALGELLAKQNRSDEAIAAMENARRCNPSDAVAAYQFATLLTAKGETARALESLKDAVRLNPMYLAAVLTLGLVYENEGRYGEAYNLYSRLIGTFSMVPDLLLHYGVCAHKLGHIEQAVQALEACLELAPESLLVHLSLGNALVAAQDRKRARAVLESSLARFPTEPRLMLQLGLVSKQEQKREESLAWFEKALQSGIENPDFFRMLAHDYAESEAFSKAADFLQRAIESTPAGDANERSQLYCELGNLHIRAGQRASAVEAYEHAIECAPENIAGYLMLGRELFRAERFDDAALVLVKARRLAPGDIEIGMTLGLVLEKLQDWEQAAAVYQEIVPKLPYDADAWYRLAWCQVRHGDAKNGEKTLRKVVKLAPQYGPAHYLLGHLFESSQRLSEALEQYKKSAETTPGALDPLLQTGKLYLQMKQWRRAAVYYGKAVEVSPDRPEGHAGLVESLYGVGEKEAAAQSLEVLRSLAPESAEALSARLRQLDN